MNGTLRYVLRYFLARTLFDAARHHTYRAMGRPCPAPPCDQHDDAFTGGVVIGSIIGVVLVTMLLFAR